MLRVQVYKAWTRSKRFLIFKHYLVRNSEAVTKYFRYYVYDFSKLMFIEIDPAVDQDLLNENRY